MQDPIVTTVVNQSQGTVNNYCRILVIDPDESPDGRYTVLGADTRHPAELVPIMRTTDRDIADITADLLSLGGIWSQHGHSFHRAAII